MFYIKNEVNGDLGISLGRGGSLDIASIFKSLVLVQLIEFESSGILPFGVLVSCVDLQGVCIVPGDLKTIFVARCSVERSQFCLVCCMY
jgi:hypothetical protein